MTAGKMSGLGVGSLVRFCSAESAGSIALLSCSLSDRTLGVERRAVGLFRKGEVGVVLEVAGGGSWNGVRLLTSAGVVGWIQPHYLRRVS